MPRQVATPSVTVRLIRSSAELQAVYRLTYEAYLAEGYCIVRKDGRLIHYPYLDGIPETRVFGAFNASGEMVGTHSWTVDGPSGLHVDDDFPIEVDSIRAEGKLLGAAWRLVVAKHFRHRRTLYRLLSTTVRGMFKSGLEVALSSFNPKHELAYTHLLRMVQVARCDETHGLEHAPSVLMRLDRGDVPNSFLRAR
jgi:hypothetical protein